MSACPAHYRMIAMHARSTHWQTDKQTDGQADEDRDNSATIRFNERIACEKLLFLDDINKVYKSTE